MTKHLKHVRHQARKHSEADQRLKWLLSRYVPKKEKVWTVFFATFVFVLLTLLLFRNWGKIVGLLQPEPKTPTVIETQGAKTGVVAVYRVEGQTVAEGTSFTNDNAEDQKKIDATGTSPTGAPTGAPTDVLPQAKEEILKDIVWVTNYLSKGQHLTRLEQEKAKSLLKSIVATYYLGEKTVDINSTLAIDTKLLSQIQNALSVDIFQYLNQAVNRADALNEYLSLLNTLKGKADQRITDLGYKISFLSTNVKSQESEIGTSEKTFFDNLKMFNGPNAEGELAKFIGLRQNQAEVRAKSGAYDSLRKYYQFFRPRLDNLIRAITANRDPLIAGVKVVEIQNMTLPLIIQQR
jgi:hypothetical protein